MACQPLGQPFYGKFRLRRERNQNVGGKAGNWDLSRLIGLHGRVKCGRGVGAELYVRRIYLAKEAGNVFTVCNTYSRDYYYDLLFRYECH